MASDEKKFSLDELPDEGSSSVSEKPTAVKVKKAEVDPRKEAIAKSTDNKDKVKILQQSWRFDVPEYLSGWIVYVLCLCAAQAWISGTDFLSRWSVLNNFVDGGLSLLGGFISHPIVFILATPFLFRFKTESELYFEINFDGINTLKKIHPGTGEFLTRNLIKWPEITNVQKTKSGSRDILQFHAKDGPVGQMIWDIDIDKKRGVKHLLNSLVVPSHPMRKFLEKDLA